MWEESFGIVTAVQSFENRSITLMRMLRILDDCCAATIPIDFSAFKARSTTKRPFARLATDLSAAMCPIRGSPI